jgi:hypothetical protein
MKNRLLYFVCILLVVLYATSCLALSNAQKRDYDSLKTAVTLSKLAVKGEFGRAIPPDFDAKVFLAVVQDKIPEQSYQVLENYPLQVIPKKGYYLLLVYDPENYSLILFSYSCEPGAEGRVLEYPENYDVNHLELYDKCRFGINR